MKKKYTVDLLIFDLDGTLIDTLKDIANSVNYALQNIGVKTLSDEQIKGFIGDGITNLMKRALQSNNDGMITDSLKYFRDHYKDHIVDNSYLYPDMDKVLYHFRYINKCIISNKSKEFTDLIIERLDLVGEFNTIIGGQSGFNYKPDPDSIQYLLNQYDANAKHAAIIGDSTNDILAGKNAGIITCAVTYGYSIKSALYSLDPDIVIEKPIELCKIFIPNKQAINKID